MNQRVLFACVAAVVPAGAASAIEFNKSFLEIDGSQDIDLSQFARAGYTAPGVYILDVVLNDQAIGRHSIEFRAAASDSNTFACLQEDLVSQFGLKQSIFETLPREGSPPCIDLSKLKGATVRHDRSAGRLKITIEQVAFEYSDPYYVPPARWSDGIPGGMIDYHVFGATSRSRGQRSSSLQAYGTMGANAGPWRFRGDYQAQVTSNAKSAFGGSSESFQFNRLYAYRSIPDIGAMASLGQQYLPTDIFDSFALTGASIESDSRMLPIGMRGYAAPITGVARTNATVVVSQQGRVLYATKVAPGSFSLQDFASTIQGTLDITVQEEDGSEQRFTVATAAVPFLAREGELRFKAAAGEPRLFGGRGIRPAFATGEFAYGLPYEFTVYGGVLGAADYSSVAAGGGKNLGVLGAVSADVTYSRAKLWWNGQTRSGRSYRFNYAKRLDALDTDLRLFGYRFSDRAFTTFPQFFGDPTMASLANSRQRMSLALSKQIGDVSSFLSYDRTNYWNRSPDERIGVSFAKTMSIGSLRNVTLNLSAFRTKGLTESSRQLYLSLSIPLGPRSTVTANATTSGNGRTSVNTGYLGSNDDGLSYAAYVGSNGGKASASANISQQTSAMQIGANALVSSEVNSASVQLDGSLLFTHHGVTPHAKGSAGNARLLVSAEGVPEVPLTGSQATTNEDGYAVIGSVMPFSPFEVQVDSSKLSLETNIANPVQRVVLTEGAIGMVSFDATHGRNALVTLTLPDGREVPLGASVVDTLTGKEAGIVGARGFTYLSGIRPESRLVIKVGARDLCELREVPESVSLESSAVSIACVPLTSSMPGTAEAPTTRTTD